MLRIHRSHPDEGFTIIPNGLLQDERLSWAARGLLVEVLSRPEGWETNADALWRKARRSRESTVAEGREVVRRLIGELEKLGYITRERVQSNDGRFVTVTNVYDTPGHVPSQANYGDRGTTSRASVSQASADRASDPWASLERTEQQETEVQRLREKDSSSLADTRAAAASASARDRGAELQELYDAVDRLNDGQLHDLDLKFEQRRPRIYRKCRREMSKQFDEKDPRILKAVNASVNADNLSLKWALKHYYETADDWPAWLVRPLGWSPQRKAA